MTHKVMLYKYLDSIWPEAPNGPVEGNFWSEIVYDLSATYSPNPDNPPFYVDLPVAFPSGEIIQEVWDRWLSFDPVVNVHERLANLRKLSGILLDAGCNDDFNLHWGHRLLSHYLTEAGIAVDAFSAGQSRTGYVCWTIAADDASSFELFFGLGTLDAPRTTWFALH
jgi:hypothetical protein